MKEGTYMKTSLDFDIDFSNSVIGICLNPTSSKDDLIKNGEIKVNIPMIMSGIKTNEPPKDLFIQTSGAVCFKNAPECRPPIKSKMISSNYISVKPNSDTDKDHVINSEEAIEKYVIDFNLERMLDPRFHF